MKNLLDDELEASPSDDKADIASDNNEKVSDNEKYNDESNE